MLRRHAPLLLWAVAALALAASRVPYDDEWFSLDLAFRTTDTQFWDALDNDVHPPWVALLDRALAPSEIALQAVRIVASLLAIALLAHTLASRLALPRWAFALAAAHPIVLFYGGSARWYPFLLLAHALRAHAIWRDGPARRSDGAAFVSGGVLGSMAGYLDPLFLAHDAAWLLVRRGRERAERLRVALAIGAALLAVVALRLASPLQTGIHDPFYRASAHWELSSALQWAAFGLAGETALPLPWLATGLACFVAAAWAFVAALREPATRMLAIWLGSYALCWLVACGFGVWLPRYSLMLWLIVGALIVRLYLHGSRAARIACGLCAAHLALGLGLAAAGRGFFKTDLNRLSDEDCAAVHAALSTSVDPALVVVPYPRLETLVFRQCDVRRPMLTLPSVRVIRAEREQLATLRGQLPHYRDVWVLSLRTESSLGQTQERVRALLAQSCRAEPARELGSAAHPELRRSSEPRYTLQRWRC